MTSHPATYSCCATSQEFKISCEGGELATRMGLAGRKGNPESRIFVSSGDQESQVTHGLAGNVEGGNVATTTPAPDNPEQESKVLEDHGTCLGSPA